MEGQGVVNYGLNKPTFGFSAETTEFDDELIRRGIVSFEETMMRKGASADEAMRLKEVKEGSGNNQESGKYLKETDDDDDDDENEFLEQHRRKRLQELKSEQSRPRFGEVFLISRPEWARHVNQDSEQSWVVVNLTSNDMERTGCVESAITALALRHVYIKFVHIPSKSAIANWPDDHLPTLFLYRFGKMQHQLLELPRDISADELEWRLHKLGLLTAEEVVEQQEPSNETGYGAVSGARSSILASLEDYDEVD
jgi:hypothetical protein